MKNNNLSERIGKIIKTKRKYKNISQTELGEYLGVSHATISRYESGKLPITIDSMDLIANYCDFRPTDYMNAFYSEEDVRKSLRKIMGRTDNIESTNAKKLEDDIVNNFSENAKPVIISVANILLDASVDSMIITAQNIILEIARNDDFKQEKRLEAYMKQFQNIYNGEDNCY